MVGAAEKDLPASCDERRAKNALAPWMLAANSEIRFLLWHLEKESARINDLW